MIHNSQEGKKQNVQFELAGIDKMRSQGLTRTCSLLFVQTILDGFVWFGVYLKKTFIASVYIVFAMKRCDSAIQANIFSKKHR